MYRNILSVLAILFLCEIGSSFDKTAKCSSEDVAKKELERLQGDWEITRTVREGEEQKETRGQIEKIRGKRWIPSRNPEDYATISVKPGTKPKSIDLKDRKGNVMLGIYKLDKGVLTLCISRSGNPRPKKFESTKEVRTFLLELKQRPD